MKRTSVEIKKFQYFYPYTVALVGAQSADRVNFMSCAWHTALSFKPPLFGILIAKKRLTHKVISEAGEFTVNFIGYELVKLSARLGRTSGYDLDKVREFKVRLSPAKLIRSPLIADAHVSFECRLIEMKPCGDHDLFVGEVLAIHEQEKSFDSEGVLNPGAARPLLYLGCDFYITVDPATKKHVVPD